MKNFKLEQLAKEFKMDKRVLYKSFCKLFVELKDKTDDEVLGILRQQLEIDRDFALKCLSA